VTARPAQRSSAREQRENGLIAVVVLAGLMWLVEVIDLIAGGELDQYGIEPRDAEGLRGIVASPFLHDGFGHLAGNTVPFLLMGFVIALSGVIRLLLVTAVVALVGGLGTWLVAPEATIHIGASGIVFGYATYLISRGLFDRDLMEIGIGLVVGVVFGGALLAGLEPQQGVSWQGHLFGGIGGVLAAWILARRRRPAQPPSASRISAP
jgi:membrane associated rhomboid family serine protease